MFIIHGLTGATETDYVRSLVRYAQKHGYRVAVMCQRGINQPLTTPVPWNGGPLDDVESAINHVKTKFPDAPIVAVGLSMGGN
jgi:predicted alpha/beta-fold hydrolase